MGREIRRVPPHWEHPKRDDGSYQPMFDHSAQDRFLQWLEDFERFKAEEMKEACEEYGYDARDAYAAFCDYDGGPPDHIYCRPNWSKSEATWFQVYETVSEGTPVTPAFETQAELVDYLVENGDFWDQKRRADPNRFIGINCAPWPRDRAEKFVGSGFAVSFVVDKKGIRSGVEALSDA